MIRGLGTAALLLLHVILCIGPLCRLSPRVPAAPLQPPPPGRDHVRARARARELRPVPVPRARRPESAGQRADGEHALRERLAVSVRSVRAGRAGDPVRDGRDQPRLLAREPDRAGLEDAAHVGVRGLRGPRAARRIRRAAGRDEPRARGGARARLRHGGRPAPGGGETRGGAGPRARAARRRLGRRVRGRPRFPRSARGSARSPASGSRSSATTASSPPSRTSASTRTGRSARARS